MIMVKVSESLASWNGACPQTNMNRITPKDHTSVTDRNTFNDTTIIRKMNSYSFLENL